MPLYGTVDAAKAMIRTKDSTVFSTDETARLTALHKFVSLYIEEQTHATFGEDPAPAESREVFGQGDPFLRLMHGVRSVSSIREDPTTYDGTVWSGGSVLAPATYVLEDAFVKRTATAAESTVYRAIRRVASTWFGRYIITGVWEDKYPTVPDDITYIANRAITEAWKSEKASPSGAIGPEGAVVYVRDAFKIQEIQDIIEAYRVGGAKVLR